MINMNIITNYIKLIIFDYLITIQDMYHKNSLLNNLFKN